MALATITARVNEADKIQFDKFCNHVGINTSTAINTFVKAVLREKRILFTFPKFKLQLYAAYIFLNLPPSMLSPFLFLL